MTTDDDIERSIFALLAQRDRSTSICPSEVARALSPASWRPLMPRVRDVAAKLAKESRLRITRGIDEIDPQRVIDRSVKGPLRLRRR